MLHTDRGVQYCATAFRGLAADRGIVQSMSRKGDCWDNACSETFFASLKTKLVGSQIFVTREQVRRVSRVMIFPTLGSRRFPTS
ncbi:MAG: hypothetical protein A2Y74_04015 [Actinobacteria bacterium RBG_13_63_9]|nr:MAG: hypothetical protein A2Y74_04015 [Actinobacteria bacterium RBG_13_63_9]